MSDLTDKLFYPSAGRIWLYIRLNKDWKWACDRLTEDADFGKKKNFFSDEARFDLGVLILVQKHNWAIFLRKSARRGSQWRSLSGHVEQIFVHKN